MYEAELNWALEPATSLPAAIRARFGEWAGRIVARTVLPWGEHCTECNAPSCYSSCDLYTPRQDAGCRLFVDGMVRVDDPGTVNGYLIKVQFKRWGKLWTVGNVRLHSRAEAARRESRNRLVGAVSRNVPLPGALKARVLRKVSYLRRRDAEEARPGARLPDAFVAEIFNPDPEAVELTLVIRATGAGAHQPFQHRIRAAPGFTRERIPFADIAARVDPAAGFGLELVPNQCENKTLYFGLLDFVQEDAPKPATAPPPAAAPAAAAVAAGATPERKWKCVVWDLDNTLWDGILLEDGAENLRLRGRALEVIRETDARGILHSIASKNNPEPVLELLSKWGIRDYFLHPQIGWRPKSESIARIARELNIGVDTLAFVDDQPFEREEVRSTIPSVTVLDAAELGTIPARPECRVTVTEESRRRRSMYQQEIQRSAALDSHGGNYKEFLKSCRIVVGLSPLDEGTLDRVYELAQRTNQMNFSGRRYPKPELAMLIKSAAHETYVIRCQDRFGAYGIVGFAVVELAGPRLLDLMFSCRVQAKRVEHAFLAHLLRRHVVEQGRDFFANYRRTPKNSESGKVFEEVGFRPVGDDNGLTSLVFRRDQSVPDDGIVEMRMGGLE